MPSELMKRFHVLRQTNPESGTDRPVSSDAVEPKVMIDGTIRQKGKRKTGIVRIPSGKKHLRRERGRRHHYFGCLGNG